jgi:hypothetical protein
MILDTSSTVPSHSWGGKPTTSTLRTRRKRCFATAVRDDQRLGVVLENMEALRCDEDLQMNK